MIDVKLTPSGLWWTAYLFVWMGRRRAILVNLHCLVNCLRMAGASSVYFAVRVLERLWSRTAFVLCFGFYLLLKYTLCWDLLLFGCIPWVWWHSYIMEVYVLFRCDVLCWDILCMLKQREKCAGVKLSLNSKVATEVLFLKRGTSINPFEN